MWWHATNWADVLHLVLQYALVVYMLVLQTITYCTSEKKEPSSKDASKEDQQVMTAIAPAKELKDAPVKESKDEKEDKETSPMASQGLDISLKSKATESKEQRSAEDAGSTEKAPPKRVFPRRRKRLAGDPAEGSEVGTENTIYERRPKIRIDSTHRSFKSLGRRQGDTLEVEPTQRPLAHSPVSPKPEELAKALLKVQRTQERKEKSVLESVREWFEEQVTQQQQIPESTTPDAQASPPRRRKSKAKPATLLPYQGTPVVHATPSEKAAKTARALRATPKQESSDGAGNNEGGNYNDLGAGEGADSQRRGAPGKSTKIPWKKL